MMSVFEHFKENWRWIVDINVISHFVLFTENYLFNANCLVMESHHISCYHVVSKHFWMGRAVGFIIKRKRWTSTKRTRMWGYISHWSYWTLNLISSSKYPIFHVLNRLLIIQMHNFTLFSIIFLQNRIITLHIRESQTWWLQICINCLICNFYLSLNFIIVYSSTSLEFFNQTKFICLDLIWAYFLEFLLRFLHLGHEIVQVLLWFGNY